MAYVIELSVEIAASPAVVWRALCDPAAVVRWDTTVVGALDAPGDYPQPGHHVRWRCRNTSELLHDWVQEVEEERRLRSMLEFGRQRMDETYVLSGGQGPGDERQGAGGGGQGAGEWTRVELRIELRVRAPFVAEPILLHLVDGPMTRRAFEGSLTNLKYYCELSVG